MAGRDYGFCIDQGPLYTAQNLSSYSLISHDECDFSSQCHSSVQNYSTALLHHCHKSCNWVPWQSAPTSCMLLHTPILYTDKCKIHSIHSPKSFHRLLRLFPVSTISTTLPALFLHMQMLCLLMAHGLYYHHLHNIFWSSIFTHALQARCEMRVSPPFILLLLSFFPWGLPQQGICLVSVTFSLVLHDSSCTFLMKVSLGWNWEESFSDSATV